MSESSTLKSAVDLAANVSRDFPTKARLMPARAKHCSRMRSSSDAT